MRRIYLDYNAAAPIRPEARDAALAALEAGGNASSVHAFGRAARSVIEQARAQVAALVGAASNEIVFTSGGSEANCLAIASAVQSGAGRLIVGAVEHPCVLDAAAACGRPVEILPVDGDGVYRLDWLEARLAAWKAGDGRPFVAVMAVNHETGVVQPIASAGALVKARGGWLHVDAVAGAGRIPLSFPGMGAHTLALSGHKIGAAPGCGALVFTSEAPLRRQIHGGGQELGLRAGSENIPGIVAFGAAASCALRGAAPVAEVEAAKERAARRLLEAGAVRVGSGAEVAPGVLCLAMEGFASHLQVMALDLDGVMVSAGAACASGKVTRSPVLTAMGLGDLADCALRVSGGWATKPADWDVFAEAWLSAYQRHSARRRLKEVA